MSEAPTAGGLLLVLALVVPFTAVLLALAAGGRNAARIAAATVPIGLAIAAATGAQLVRSGEAIVYHLGGWTPPLGVALRADGLAAAMMLVTAVVVAGVAVFARDDFRAPPGRAEGRAPLAFWTLLIAVWGSLNTVFLAGDLFTLYVALELLTFAAVPLVCLDGRAETLRAALRYLVFALAGSILYLLGAVLAYGQCGTLDVGLLAGCMGPNAATWTAAALMTAGLAAKTALFPLHLWLPPAHAGAPAAASAVLSALVVKGSFFIVVRLWFDVLPGAVTPAAAQALGALGAGAIVFGSVVALRQARLKLMVAYSTVAQIGYLFLMFPLAWSADSGRLAGGAALAGGLMQALSHATAKAGMFMAAGLVYAALGHDRVAGLAGAARLLPVTFIAFGLGGISLMGLPPSGGFVAKWLLLSSAVSGGQWWWAAVILVGGLLTGSYLLLVLARAMAAPAQPLAPAAPVAPGREYAALALAGVSALLGLAAFGGQDFLHLGRESAVGGGAR